MALVAAGASVATADVENAPVQVALAAVADVLVHVEQKDLHSPLSISLKLKTKTSSWHFFFVSYNRQLHTNLFFAAIVSLLSPRFVMLLSA